MWQVPSMKNVQRLQEIFRDLSGLDEDGVRVPMDPCTFRDPEGDSLLHIAAVRGDLESITLLLELGVDRDLRGDMGCTPLHYAAKFHQREAFDLLVSAGADTRVRDDFGFLSGDFLRGRSSSR